MKEITIKLDDEWFNRLNEARKLESPNVRNTTLCRRMVEKTRKKKKKA